MNSTECHKQSQRVDKFRNLVEKKTNLENALANLNEVAKVADKDGHFVNLRLQMPGYNECFIPSTIVTNVEICKALLPVYEQRARELAKEIEEI